ncbi:response regulator receiver domain-containing protein [Tahibacter aquaticus]|uniref:Response regulator receiver domain-containing protein n=1 Tax=Tahibacter aquaticus TaxID=520092 RepID=A0A4R6YMU8_9GAMM|nr:response regulator [Tahibacter aquaticus]TDR38876.1 response regulator receiver domain-containing protein [Tahibacter aquaticus]
MTPAKPCVVLIDDEERILRSLSMLLRGRYDVLATTNPVQVLDWVRQRPVHVVVSDQRMPTISGVDLLRQIREHSPRSMRLLLTGYADLAAVEAAVNDGEIFRFLEKPWDAAKLQEIVALAAQIAQADFERADAAPAVPIAAATTHFGGVLVLDEDPGSAALVRSLLPASCPVATATTVEAAMALLEAQEYAVLVAELRHSSDDVIAALKLLKQASPRTLAVACSSLRDGRLLIDLINQGQVFRFLPKPLGKELLRRALLAALERHGELRHEPHRLRRHVVEAPRQVSLSGRVMDYLRRIRDQAKLRA